jgi:hypothetical protein
VGKSRMRLWVTSIVAGCVISGILTAVVRVTGTGIAFYFPPFWPGLFVAWIVIIFSHGRSWAGHFGIVLTTAGNAALYSWAALKVIKAEVSAGGRVGRYLA